MHKIGVNINQIAKKVNTTGDLYPEEMEEFVSRTGADSLAIAIGTSHGAFKFKPGQKPRLRFDILEEIEKRLQNFLIVLHGAFSVSQKYVEIIQANGGIWRMPSGSRRIYSGKRRSTLYRQCFGQ